MILYATLLALLLGVAFEVSVAGRAWTFSYIDAVGVGVAMAGGVVAWRRRAVRFDAALLAYGGLLVVLAVQAVVRPDIAEIVGGSSRFVTALLLLFGLSQFVVGEEPWTERWRWPTAFSAFGAVLAVTVLGSLVLALGDPDLVTFYDVKKAVVVPLGGSNYLAAFLLVAGLVGLVHAFDRRVGIVLPALTLIGLIATMSRAAIGAAILVLIGVVVVRRQRQFLVRVVAAVGGAIAVFVVVAVTAASLAGDGGVELAIPDLSRPADAPAAEGESTPDDRAPALTERFEGAISVVAAGGRRQLFAASWDAFVDHPLIGIGVNQLEEYSGRGGHPPHVNAHNLVLHALATTGLLGTVAYLALWAILLLRLWRLPSGTAKTALLAGVLALLLHAQVEALSHTRAVEALLVVILVIAGSAPGAFGVRVLGPGGDGDRG